jgi:hypothetical protein
MCEIPTISVYSDPVQPQRSKTHNSICLRRKAGGGGGGGGRENQQVLPNKAATETAWVWVSISSWLLGFTYNIAIWTLRYASFGQTYIYKMLLYAYPYHTWLNYISKTTLRVWIETACWNLRSPIAGAAHGSATSTGRDGTSVPRARSTAKWFDGLLTHSNMVFSWFAYKQIYIVFWEMI